MKNYTYLDHINDIATDDVGGLRKAQESYGDSWKRRGGVGAFMMLARKWDRLENRCKSLLSDKEGRDCAYPFDIFGHIAADERSEGLIDDVRDLRRYLLLVEAEMRARGVASATSTHRDNS